MEEIKWTKGYSRYEQKNCWSYRVANFEAIVVKSCGMYWAKMYEHKAGHMNHLFTFPARRKLNDIFNLVEENSMIKNQIREIEEREKRLEELGVRRNATFAPHKLSEAAREYRSRTDMSELYWNRMEDREYGDD